MTRRAVVASLAGSALGVLLRPVIRWAGCPNDTDAEFARDLSEMFGTRAGRRVIGRAYLRARPADGNPVALLAAVRSSSLLAEVDLACLPPEGRRAWLARQVRQDFREGHTTSVEGWVLSVTEARLCALACFC